MSSDCDSDDEKHFARLPENWIAVFHLRERSGSSVDDLHKECTSMIDRVTCTVVYIYMYHILIQEVCNLVSSLLSIWLYQSTHCNDDFT